MRLRKLRQCTVIISGIILKPAVLIGILAVGLLGVFIVQEMTVRVLKKQLAATRTYNNQLEDQMWVNANEYAKNYILNCGWTEDKK